MKKEILFGICADVHQGKTCNEAPRLKKFIDEANERGADFIIQLGDFTHPDEGGKLLLDEWNKFNGNSYHVLGNHDSEKYGKERAMEFLGMKEKYYSFDSGCYHFIVLDTNYIKIGKKYVDYHSPEYDTDFFGCYIPDEQLAWLAKDIDSTDKRCFIFTHAALAVGDYIVYNLHDMQDILWAANEKAGYNKVTMCFSGHDHADAYIFKGGIHYLLVNSLSHKYIGPNCFESANKDQLVEYYGKIKDVIPYKDPLYAFVRLKENGLIQIIGKQSEYDGNSPIEVNWEHYASPQIAYREVWMDGKGRF